MKVSNIFFNVKLSVKNPRTFVFIFIKVKINALKQF